MSLEHVRAIRAMLEALGSESDDYETLAFNICRKLCMLYNSHLYGSSDIDDETTSSTTHAVSGLAVYLNRMIVLNGNLIGSLESISTKALKISNMDAVKLAKAIESIKEYLNTYRSLFFGNTEKLIEILSWLKLTICPEN